MNAATSITAPLDAATLALVEELALREGVSPAVFAAEAIRRAAMEEPDFATFVQAGVAAVERGDVYTQDQMERWFEERVAARSAG